MTDPRRFLESAGFERAYVEDVLDILIPYGHDTADFSYEMLVTIFAADAKLFGLTIPRLYMEAAE